MRGNFLIPEQMKKIYFLLLAFVCTFSVGQAQDSLDWKVTTKKINERQYALTFSTTVPEGYFVYVHTPANSGPDGFAIIFNDSSIHPHKGLTVLNGGKNYSDPLFDNQTMEIASGNVTIVQEIQFTTEVPAQLRAKLLYTLGGKDVFIPGIEQPLMLTMEGGKDIAPATRLLIPQIDVNAPMVTCGNEVIAKENNSLWGLFMLGFLGGLIALLTPCVFPMIPLTVSFFTKKAQDRKKGIRNALWYGFFIFLIYLLLSLPFHFLDTINPEILNNISTNVGLNIFFFLIFIFFALSFFGFYEITMPASLANKVDAKSGVGNIPGIFFMALTLALVSFSCTGPILGSLLAGSLSSDGGAIQLTAGMGGFGLALALPFALFALFPQWLNSLPKSGGWLTTVKVVLGFAELALAFKFLSNADLVKHWGLLKREVFIGIWIIIGAATVLYLLGKIRFPHDTPPKKLGMGRIAAALAFLAFTLYLMPGLTNTSLAKLPLISGFPPPTCYSVYAKPVNCEEPFKDYETALRYAREKNKPLLIDFTGWACVNCRRMEENVWVNPEVKKLMTEDFVLVSLYVDDRQLLPAKEQMVYVTKEGVEKEIRTVGDKWATFETENFRNNSQPWYAILTPDEKLVNYPIGYTPDAATFKAWLQCGLEAFQKASSSASASGAQ